MKTVINILLIAAIVTACRTEAEQAHTTERKVLRENYGNNIVVLLDLSNRVLRAKSVHDTTIVFSILSKLKPIFEKSRDKNIMDKFSIYSINQHCVDRMSDTGKLKFNIDLSRFEKKERAMSDYLYARSEETYDNDLAEIRHSVKALYADNKDKKILPADIWYYFNDVLNGTVIDTTARQNSGYVNRLRNKVILITDGYVEAGKYAEEKTMFSKQDPNKTKFLSGHFLRDFRRKFNASSESNIEKFYQDNGYGLVPVENPLLSKIDLLVLEFHDRTIENGVTTVSPPDHRIMKLFWKDWMSASGVSEDRLTIYDVFKNEREMNVVISQFLNR